jgi:hypothetical protein
MTARQARAGFRIKFEKTQYICSLQSNLYSRIAVRKDFFLRAFNRRISEKPPSFRMLGLEKTGRRGGQDSPVIGQGIIIS